MLITVVPSFEYVEHTADVGIKAFGRDINEAFENAAFAVFELITDTSKVQIKERRSIEVRALDLEGLLYKWIEALIVLHDSEGLVFSKFAVSVDEETKTLYGEALGEKFDPSRHEGRIVVKAITYHEMRVERVDSLVVLNFVVDI